VRRVEIPKFKGTFSIWGATGRDHRGHIWFGVCGHDLTYPTGHLFELNPATGKVTDRGDLISALKANKVYQPDELQMKIHSKIIQGCGGHLYFVSMDENFEDMRAEKLPKWGGHMWRYRLPENRWEHLLRTREPLIAAAGGKRYLYGMGYFGHKVYRYDLKTRKVLSVRVGSTGGHVSRNIIVDAREHLFVPRLERDGRELVASLVEYDTNLRELRATKLRHYIRRNPVNCHGIIGYQPLPDGRIVFSTHHGFLYVVEPTKGEAPSQVRELGWFHPRGSSYAPSLFLDAAGENLMGVTARRGRHQWVTYNLKTRRRRAETIDVTEGKPIEHRKTLLYGSITRDDSGNCYLVGKEIVGFKSIKNPTARDEETPANIGEAEGHELNEGKRRSISEPIVLQVHPGDRRPAK